MTASHNVRHANFLRIDLALSHPLWVQKSLSWLVLKMPAGLCELRAEWILVSNSLFHCWLVGLVGWLVYHSMIQ